MYGYEYELQRLRNERLRVEADTRRLALSGERSEGHDFRRVLGQQLVKLGTRLQGDARKDHSLAAA